MIEVLWHGRGGQGAFTAARLLGAAATLSDNRFALAFPSFGPERRGAPMRAFTKVSEVPIGDRTAVEKADFVVYLDGTLFAPGWETELKPGGICLVNSLEPASDDPRVFSIDANGLSAAALGRPIPNTVFLGALSALGSVFTREDIEEAIRQYMPEKLHAKNIALVDEAAALAAFFDVDAARGFEPVAELAVANEPAVDDSIPFCEPLPEEQTVVNEPDSAEEVVVETSVTPAPVDIRAAGIAIPTLRDSVPGPEVYAQDTCFEGGFLTQKNAGWRNVRPVIDAEKCTGCLQCYLYCPDGTIFRRVAQEGDAPKPAVAVDLDFCKGCGVCAQVCGFDAIRMENEAEALAAEHAAATKEVA